VTKLEYETYLDEMNSYTFAKYNSDAKNLLKVYNSLIQADVDHYMLSYCLKSVSASRDIKKTTEAKNTNRKYFNKFLSEIR